MIRYPPTSITLCDEDLDHHFQRILLCHGLVSRFQQLRPDHDDNNYGSGPAQFDSYSRSSRFGPSSGLSDSDSGPGFDSVLAEKLSEGKGSKGSSNTSALSSGSHNTADMLDAPGGSGSFLSIAPIGSVDSQTRHSISTSSWFGQHDGPYSVGSRHPLLFPACSDITLPESRAALTSQTRVPSQLQHTEPRPLEVSCSSLSLRVSAGFDSSSPAAESLNVLSLETTGPEADQHFASPNRIRHPPRSDLAVKRDHRTISLSHTENNNNPGTANASDTQRPPRDTNQNPKPASEAGKGSVRSSIWSTALDWTDIEHSPAHNKHRRCGHPGPSPSGSSISSFTSTRTGGSHRPTPSFGQVLAESKKLLRYFRTMVADLGNVDGPDGLRRETV